MNTLSDPRQKNVFSLLKYQSEKFPDAVAIQALNGAAISYAELAHRVESMVLGLRGHGVAAGSRVAIVLPNGLDMALALLGVSSAAIAIPLNPVYKEPEYEAYFSETEADFLLALEGGYHPAKAVAEKLGIQVLELPEGGYLKSAITQTGTFVEPPSPENVAMVLLTSGSTGRPKRVPLTHHNLCTSAGHVRESLSLSRHDCCLSMWEQYHIGGLVDLLLAPLSSGGKVICAGSFDAGRFYEILREHSPTWFQGVPITLRELVLYGKSCGDAPMQISLRFIRSVAAPLAPSLMGEIEEYFGVPVIQTFGMTEASPLITTNLLPPNLRKPGSAGKTCGPEVAIMDDKGRQMSSGKLGEVAVRGENIFSGYESNPEANAEAFRDGWFHTGDTGYLDEDGYLYLVGRIKEMINRGGEKIAPVEVDDVIKLHPAVMDAAVFPVQHETLGEDVAVAVVLKQGQQLSRRDLLDFAGRHLAHFKVPRNVYFVNQIPRTSNGKIQRFKLAGISAEFGPAQSDAVGGYAAAEGAVEKELAKIWARILKIDRIGLHDDFFDLGGDSLKAASFINELHKKWGGEVYVTALFDAPTISRFMGYLGHRYPDILSRMLDRQVTPEDLDSSRGIDQEIDLIPVARDSDISLTSGQQRIFALAEMRHGRSVYNISTAFRIKGGLNISALERSLNELQKRHEILRTSFPLSDTGRPRQKVSPSVPILLPLVDVFNDVRRLSPGRQEIEASRLLQEELSKPFDLKNGPLWRAKLFKLKGKPTSWWRSRLQWYKQDEYVLSLTMHHMIFDGFSKNVLLEELSVAYNAFNAGEIPELSEIPVQYADYAYWQKRWLQSREAERQLDYWRGISSGEIFELVIPTDHPRPASASARGGSIHFDLPDQLAGLVGTICQEERTSPYIVLLSAFSCLLHSYSDQKRFFVCSPLASRNRSELEGLIGYFNNVVPIFVDLGGDPSFRDVLGRAKKVFMEALENQNIPLQEVAELPQFARVPLNRAVFTFQDATGRTLNLSGLVTEFLEIRKDSADFDLAMTLEKTVSQVHGILEYNADIFEAETIRQMIRNYQTVLGQVLADLDAPLSGLPRFGRDLRDIEKLLEAHPKIDQAVVVRVQGRTQPVAYLVLNEDDVPQMDEISAHAKEILPDYLVPAVFLPLDQIPIDQDGAIDYMALPLPGRNAKFNGDKYAAPRTDLEKKLAAVWKKVLWLDHEVGINDHFLELGGHSLLSVQLVLALEKELGRPLPEKVLNQLTTIAEMAVLLEQPANVPEAVDVGGQKKALALSGTEIPARVLHELRSYTASWEGRRARSESIIVGLNTNGSKQALFWCLQRYGELTQLAKHLGNEQPVYGMRSGSKVIIKTPENIRALAEYYVTEILEIQPVGPFLLGGNCQAADIAFQAAEKLRELGHEISLLILHEKFVPREYTGKVALMFGAGSIFNPFLSYENPQMGWGKYYTGGFTFDIVPGTHGEFFREPNIQVLCTKLQQRMHESQGLRDCVDASFNTRFGQRLPTEAYRARILAPKRLQAEPGKELRIILIVENASSLTWPENKISGLFLASRWLNSKGKAVELGARVPLMADLAPAETVEVELSVRCPDKPGDWILELDMVDEGVAWFNECGSELARVYVRVERAGGGWLRYITNWQRTSG